MITNKLEEYDMKKLVSLSNRADQCLREMLADRIRKGEKVNSSMIINKAIEYYYLNYKAEDLGKPKPTALK